MKLISQFINCQTRHLSVCVSLCVCVFVWSVCWRVLVLAKGFICLEYLECQGTDQRCCVEDVTISTSFLHRYLRMKHQAFLTSHFILFALQKQQKARITSVCLTFKPQGLPVPLSDIALVPHYIKSRSTSGVRHSYKGSQSNYERLQKLQNSVLYSVPGKV